MTVVLQGLYLKEMRMLNNLLVPYFHLTERRAQKEEACCLRSYQEGAEMTQHDPNHYLG